MTKINTNMRILSIKNVAALLLLAATTVTISAEQSKPVKDLFKKAPRTNVDGINYKLDVKDHEAMVVAGENLYTGEITIPEKITVDSVTYYVEEIDNGAFKKCASLVKVNIPSTITVIGSSAFEDCTSLTEITIPTSVKEIEDNLFTGCSSLTTVNLHDGITSIQHNAFKKCSALETIKLPSGASSCPTHSRK